MPQKILLVEDNSLLRKSTRDIIENLLICEVFESENGKVALEMIHGGLRPDIIISDIEMPEMNGFELLKALKSYNIPIITMSGKSKNEHENFESRSLEQGATAFLIKPVDPDILELMINKYARRP